MAGIPTSNKAVATKSAGKDKDEAPSVVDTPEFQQKIKDTIGEVKNILDITNNEMVKTENMKLENVHRIGLQINKLLVNLGNKAQVGIIKQFHSETRMDPSWFYRARMTADLLTKDDIAKLKKNCVTVQALYALLACKKSSEPMFKKMLDRALNQGISADEIRTSRKVSGKRKEAYAKRKQAADKKKPPIRVFTQGLERLVMMDESLGSCVDAVNRLAECKTDAEREEAIAMLVELRKKAIGVQDQLTSFMKYTSNFSTK